MMKTLLRITFPLAVLALAVAEAALPDEMEAAVRFRGFSAFRRNFNRFAAVVSPENHYPDMPDVWLLSALRLNGLESIDRRGDIFVFRVRSQQGVGLVYAVPVRSQNLFVDSLKASRTSETTPEGIMILRQEESAGFRQEKIGVYTADGTAAVSDNTDALLHVARLLEAGNPADLFSSCKAGSVQVLMRGSFLQVYRNSILQAAMGMQMIAAVMMASPQTMPVVQQYNRTVLGFFENADLIEMTLWFDAEDFITDIGVFPSADSGEAAFVARQKVAERNLLELPAGRVLFAAGGRVEKIESLDAAHAALVAPAHARTGRLEQMLDVEKERLERFGENFGGHFAAALVVPENAPSDTCYVRVYEVKDAARARENFKWEMESFDGAAISATRQGDETISGCNVLVYQVTPLHAMLLHNGEPVASDVRAAFTDGLMLLATGQASAQVIEQIIKARADKPGDSIVNTPAYSRTFRHAPAEYCGRVYFSFSELQRWASMTRPDTNEMWGTDSVPPEGGIGVSFNIEAKTLKIRITFPTAELAMTGAISDGNSRLPLLRLPE